MEINNSPQDSRKRHTPHRQHPKLKFFLNYSLTPALTSVLRLSRAPKTCPMYVVHYCYAPCILSMYIYLYNYIRHVMFNLTIISIRSIHDCTSLSPIRDLSPCLEKPSILARSIPLLAPGPYQRGGFYHGTIPGIWFLPQGHFTCSLQSY